MPKSMDAKKDAKKKPAKTAKEKKKAKQEKRKNKLLNRHKKNVPFRFPCPGLGPGAGGPSRFGTLFPPSFQASQDGNPFPFSGRERAGYHHQAVNVVEQVEKEKAGRAVPRRWVVGKESMGEVEGGTSGNLRAASGAQGLKGSLIRRIILWMDSLTVTSTSTPKASTPNSSIKFPDEPFQFFLGPGLHRPVIRSFRTQVGQDHFHS